MAKETAVGKFIQDTPQWAKGVIALAAIGGGYLLYRNIKKTIDAKKGGSGGEGGVPASKLPSNINQDITIAAKKSPLSYRLSQYDEWASALHNAMFGCGTDEDTIYRIMGYMKNDTDVLQLIKAFGVRKEPKRLFVPCPYGEGTLSEYLTNELDKTEIGIVNKTLAAKKNPSITIRF